MSCGLHWFAIGGRVKSRTDLSRKGVSEEESAYLRASGGGRRTTKQSGLVGGGARAGRAAARRLDAEIARAGEKMAVDMSPAKDGSKRGLITRVTKADGTIPANVLRPTQ